MDAVAAESGTVDLSGDWLRDGECELEESVLFAFVALCRQSLHLLLLSSIQGLHSRVNVRYTGDAQGSGETAGR